MAICLLCAGFMQMIWLFVMSRCHAEKTDLDSDTWVLLQTGKTNTEPQRRNQTIHSCFLGQFCLYVPSKNLESPNLLRRMSFKPGGAAGPFSGSKKTILETVLTKHQATESGQHEMLETLGMCQHLRKIMGCCWYGETDRESWTAQLKAH